MSADDAEDAAITEELESAVRDGLAERVETSEGPKYCLTEKGAARAKELIDTNPEAAELARQLKANGPN